MDVLQNFTSPCDDILFFKSPAAGKERIPCDEVTVNTSDMPEQDFFVWISFAQIIKEVRIAKTIGKPTIGDMVYLNISVPC